MRAASLSNENVTNRKLAKFWAAKRSNAEQRNAHKRSAAERSSAQPSGRQRNAASKVQLSGKRATERSGSEIQNCAHSSHWSARNLFKQMGFPFTYLVNAAKDLITNKSHHMKTWKYINERDHMTGCNKLLIWIFTCLHHIIQMSLKQLHNSFSYPKTVLFLFYCSCACRFA